MDRLTTQQRIKIIKTYYENGNSATATYRALRGDYGAHNRPTTQAIGKIVKKFEETGAVTDIVRPVHHRFARSAENIAAVAESVEENPGLSIPRRSLQLGISKTSLHRILHKDLGLKGGPKGGHHREGGDCHGHGNRKRRANRNNNETDEINNDNSEPTGEQEKDE